MVTNQGPLGNWPAYNDDFTIESYIYFPYTINGFDFFSKDDFCHISMDEDDYGYVDFTVVVSTGIVGELKGFSFFTRDWNVTGGWHHIAVTFEASSKTIGFYLDGDLLPASSSLTTNVYTPTTTLRLERGSTYKPYVDELRVSKTIRHTTEFTPSTIPFSTDLDTSGLWHFEEVSGATQFSDSSGNSNTLVGSDGARIAVLTTHVVSINRPGNGTGSINFDSVATICSDTSTSCNRTLEEGITVTLSTEASVGSNFIGWSGEGCSGTPNCIVTMDSAKIVTANFSLTNSLTGDVDSSDELTLADAIVALQVVTAATADGQSLDKNATLIPSEPIGVVDAIYIMKTLAK
ncbi:MAG: LamG domain-containing protein [Desulfobulbaceae bacterium]|nr:LamG domain-containing protein [Desulfobulbaceae bacterium]